MLLAFPPFQKARVCRRGGCSCRAHDDARRRGATDVLLLGSELQPGMLARLVHDGDTLTPLLTISRAILATRNNLTGLPQQMTLAGVREDGTLVTWTGSASHWWAVRKDSLEPPGDTDDRLDTARKQGQQDVIEWLRGSGSRAVADLAQIAMANGELL